MNGSFLHYLQWLVCGGNAAALQLEPPSHNALHTVGLHLSDIYFTPLPQ